MYIHIYKMSKEPTEESAEDLIRAVIFPKTRGIYDCKDRACNSAIWDVVKYPTIFNIVILLAIKHDLVIVLKLISNIKTNLGTELIDGNTTLEHAIKCEAKKSFYFLSELAIKNKILKEELEKAKASVETNNSGLSIVIEKVEIKIEDDKPDEEDRSYEYIRLEFLKTELAKGNEFLISLLKHSSEKIRQVVDDEVLFDELLKDFSPPTEEAPHIVFNPIFLFTDPWLKKFEFDEEDLALIKLTSGKIEVLGAKSEDSS